MKTYELWLSENSKIEYLTHNKMICYARAKQVNHRMHRWTSIIPERLTGKNTLIGEITEEDLFLDFI